MTDYSKGLIYLIKHVDDFNNENCYFGSTTNFKARKSLHKHDCNNEKSKSYNTEKYKYIRANGGWINFIMLEIEKFSCKSKNQLTKREDDVMSEYKIRLNTNRACRSQKEYQENQKEEIAEQRKEHYQNHKEEYQEKHKKYYENHKEEIAEKNKEKITCECGCIISKSSMRIHKKTVKHLQNICAKNNEV